MKQRFRSPFCLRKPSSVTKLSGKMDFGERLEFFLPGLSDLEFFLPSLSDLEFFLPSQPIVCYNTIRQNGHQRATFSERHSESDIQRATSSERHSESDIQRATFRERHLRSPEFH